jgi:hypothetical protein
MALNRGSPLLDDVSEFVGEELGSRLRVGIEFSTSDEHVVHCGEGVCSDLGAQAPSCRTFVDPNLREVCTDGRFHLPTQRATQRTAGAGCDFGFETLVDQELPAHSGAMDPGGGVRVIHMVDRIGGRCPDGPLSSRRRDRFDDLARDLVGLSFVRIVCTADGQPCLDRGRSAPDASLVVARRDR